MKNLLTATLPALAALALSGCATTGAISSTENDGVYYSSQDRTTAATTTPAAGYQNTQRTAYNGYDNNPNTAQVTTPATENANPDYQGGTTQTGTTTASGTDYYDDSYTSASPSGFGQPYTGPGVSTYNYTPSWSVSPSVYASPFGYGTGLSIGYGYGGYSPYSYGYGGFGGFGYPAYGGFYDPFYSPFGYGYGSGLSLGFGYGFGSPFYGGFGYPYSLYGYGYGYPYGGGYYGDYGYGGGYYNRSVIYANGTRSGTGDNPVLVGPRGSRGGSVLNRAASPNGSAVNSNIVNIGNGRRGNAVDQPNSVTGQGNATPAGRGAWRAASFGGGEVVGQPAANNAVPNAQSAAAAQGQNAGRRGGFFREVFGNNGAGTTNSGNVNSDTQGQRRGYFNQANQAGQSSQPAYQQRSFSQPSRSFEQRSFSQPTPQRSFGGGGGNFGGGGGSFGGGGGGGRRR